MVFVATNSGGASSTVKVNGASSVSKGDLLGWDAGSLEPALAGSIRAVYVAMSAASAGGKVLVQSYGDVDVSLETGATPSQGNASWLSKTEAGKVTSTVPSISDTGVQRVGTFSGGRDANDRASVTLGIDLTVGGSL